MASVLMNKGNDALKRAVLKHAQEIQRVGKIGQDVDGEDKLMEVYFYCISIN